MGESNQKQERRFSQEQYDMLKRCSEKEDMTEWNEWRKENQGKILSEIPDLDMKEVFQWFEDHKENILLEGADLEDSYLKGADLCDAHLAGANLKAYLEDVKLNNAHLEGADLIGAYLKNASLWNANIEDVALLDAELEGAELIGANLENSTLQSANLKNAKLQRANLEGVNFWESQLQGATLCWAKLRGADFHAAHLEGADLMGADLKGTVLEAVHLEGAKCRNITVDVSTVISGCTINHRTDFRGVGLENMCIDEGTKELLKYNVRRMNWEEWYKEHWFWRWPVQLFWEMSDYGLSTLRVVGVFFLLAFLFAGIYMNCAYWRPPGIIDNLTVEPAVEQEMSVVYYFWLALVRPIYFSIVTMTTLGFGDMYANKGSVAGHVILAVQVILGYVLLGALITRFAVLFTAGGPAGKFEEQKKKVDSVSGDNGIRGQALRFHSPR